MNEKTFTEEPPADADELGPTTSVTIRILCSLLPLAASVGVLWAVSDLEFGSLHEPGPAFWPAACTIFAGLLSCLLLVRLRTTPPPEMWTGGAVRASLATLAVMGGVCLVPIIGFEIPILLILFGGARLFGRETWVTAGITAIVSTISLHLIFVTALAIPLPALVH